MNDLISRQAAIEAVGYYSLHSGDKLLFADKPLKDLPSAQPEIIRCKDCRWKQGSECVRFADVRPSPNDFCSRAERRTDE